ncbi:hypothetical protein DAPPUDRAFT_328599 [Daphnia pulex]|uniref:RRM domain-containing protein n=1 Tax=Daphnia pulex TaxID=6669 RepID=E9HE66_DAPPU|nr:hypothetical protein DAPPUDRAFT_328599 [Daphnia pulex]|eukprot:EFX69983.1 hypothetical protein DAPPUDRAFT_328599 [Daphnia pulex]
MTPLQEDHQEILCCNILHNVCKDELLQMFSNAGKSWLFGKLWILPEISIFSSLKVACVRNLPHDFTEEKLQEVFEVHGPIQRVKILEDYAYKRIENREDAVHALDALDGYAKCEVEISVLSNQFLDNNYPAIWS